jgi:hypothetical protein
MNRLYSTRTFSANSAIPVVVPMLDWHVVGEHLVLINRDPVEAFPMADDPLLGHNATSTVN